MSVPIMRKTQAHPWGTEVSGCTYLGVPVRAGSAVIDLDVTVGGATCVIRTRLAEIVSAMMAAGKAKIESFGDEGWEEKADAD